MPSTAALTRGVPHDGRIALSNRNGGADLGALAEEQRHPGHGQVGDNRFGYAAGSKLDSYLTVNGNDAGSVTLIVPLTRAAQPGEPRFNPGASLGAGHDPKSEASGLRVQHDAIDHPDVV